MRVFGSLFFIVTLGWVGLSAVPVAACTGTCVPYTIGCGTGSYEGERGTCTTTQSCCISTTSMTTAAGCAAGYTKVSGVCFPTGTGLSENSVLEIVTRFVNWLLAIFGFIAILGFVISGIQYLTSAGDESQAETAKRNMKYSIIGVVVALSGWIVILFVEALLNATL